MPYGLGNTWNNMPTSTFGEEGVANGPQDYSTSGEEGIQNPPYQPNIPTAPPLPETVRVHTPASAASFAFSNGGAPPWMVQDHVMKGTYGNVHPFSGGEPNRFQNQLMGTNAPHVDPKYMAQFNRDAAIAAGSGVHPGAMPQMNAVELARAQMGATGPRGLGGSQVPPGGGYGPKQAALAGYR